MTSNKDAVYKDTDGNRRTPADYGATWLSTERISEPGLTVVDEGYEKPVSEDEKKERELHRARLALDSEYDAYNVTNMRAYMGAIKRGDSTMAATILQEGKALQGRYYTKNGGLKE